MSGLDTHCNTAVKNVQQYTQARIQGPPPPPPPKKKEGRKGKERKEKKRKGEKRIRDIKKLSRHNLFFRAYIGLH